MYIYIYIYICMYAVSLSDSVTDSLIGGTDSLINWTSSY